MLDFAGCSPDLEELQREVDGGSVSMVGVSFKLDVCYLLPVGAYFLLSCRFFWGLSGAPLGVYVIVQDLNIPLIIQPHAFAALSILSWAQV